MKVLVDELEWIKISLWELPEGSAARIAGLDSWIKCAAIAEALPEIPVYVDGIEIKPERQPPKPIIERPPE